MESYVKLEAVKQELVIQEPVIQEPDLKEKVFSPTHKRTEGRAPVWGSEFTSKRRRAVNETRSGRTG